MPQPGNSRDHKQLRYNAKILPGQMNLIVDLDISLVPPQQYNQETSEIINNAEIVPGQMNLIIEVTEASGRPHSVTFSFLILLHKFSHL